jgi:hypothetical protein
MPSKTNELGRHVVLHTMDQSKLDINRLVTH